MSPEKERISKTKWYPVSFGGYFWLKRASNSFFRRIRVKEVKRSLPADNFEKNMIQLGPFEIEHPFILAPMAGITNSPHRRLMRRRKSALVVSELVSANGIEYASRKTLELLDFHEEERLVGLQIFGEDEDRLVKASQVVEEKGADFVDLNLGCPVPKVVKKGGGSAMCRDPIALGKILTAMVKSVKIPVSIKIRTGWDSHSKNALEVVNAATDAGVAWVAIHGRTRAQGYSGEAEWDLIGNVKAKSSIPIIGNGDLTTPEKAVDRLKTYGVDAVMIGRGALRNPFIFEQAFELWNEREVEPLDFSHYESLLKEQRALLAEYFDDKKAFLHAKKFLAWYSAGFRDCHDFRRSVFQAPSEEALWEMAFVFFKESAGQRNAQFLEESFLMGGHG
jgi:tRNA-dihydrouridine synthase B